MEAYIARRLGLDIGDRWVGVALSDPRGILASPLTIIERHDEKADAEAIAEIARKNEVEHVIVGLPCAMDGGIGQQAAKVKAFAEELSRHVSVPIEFRDERLTTLSAKRLMREAGRKTKRGRDDAVAAALILQGYLDEASEMTPPPSLLP